MRAVYKRTCEFPTSDMARWLSHKPPLPTWSGNITWHYFMSSHFILSLRGVSKCVFHAPGSLIKCRGSLVVRPPGIPDYFQISQTSCCQKQIPHKHPDVAHQNSPPEAESFRNRQITCSEFASLQFFHPRFQRVICFYQPSSLGIALNGMKLPLVLCWSKQHNVTDIWAPCSMSQHNTVGNSTHIEDHVSGSQNRAPAAWCAWKAPNQRVARWLSHKPPLPTWHDT